MTPEATTTRVSSRLQGRAGESRGGKGSRRLRGHRGPLHSSALIGAPPSASAVRLSGAPVAPQPTAGAVPLALGAIEPSQALARRVPREKREPQRPRSEGWDHCGVVISVIATIAALHPVDACFDAIQRGEVETREWRQPARADELSPISGPARSLGGSLMGRAGALPPIVGIRHPPTRARWIFISPTDSEVDAVETGFVLQEVDSCPCSTAFTRNVPEQRACEAANHRAVTADCRVITARGCFPVKSTCGALRRGTLTTKEVPHPTAECTRTSAPRTAAYR
jgi:hypothetical protein